MTAELTEETAYSWYCDECGEGGTDYVADEIAAIEEMEKHNEEHHSGEKSEKTSLEAAHEERI